VITSGMDERDERKQTSDDASKQTWTTSKPGPFPSVVSTGDWSQSLIGRSMSPSAMRRAIDFISSACGTVSKYPAQIGVDHVGVALPEQEHHRMDRLGRPAPRPIAVRGGVDVRLEDRLDHQFRRGLRRSLIVGMPSGRSPPPGFGIITRRTASGRYVFVRRSSPSRSSQSSSPSASIRSNVTPSAPDAPPLARAKS
jgi:hypothetical protein